MSPTIKNILAVIVGWLIGSMVNMGLVTTGHSVFPIEGLDPEDMEAYAAIMPTLSAEHFVFPFLAHALGTLVGAAIAAYFAVSNKMRYAMIVGVIFLIGGIAINFMLPGPLWFTIVDVVLAFIPMAFLGGRIGSSLSKK